jgi:hypothetical protein
LPPRKKTGGGLFHNGREGDNGVIATFYKTD